MKKLLISLYIVVIISTSVNHSYAFFEEIKEIPKKTIETINSFVEDKKQDITKKIDNYVDVKKQDVIDELHNDLQLQGEKMKQELQNDLQVQSEKIKYELQKNFQEQSEKIKYELQEETNKLKNEIDSWKSTGIIVLKYLIAIFLIISIIRIILFIIVNIIKYFLYKNIHKFNTISFYTKNTNKTKQIEEKIEIRVNKSMDILIDKTFFIKSNSILKYGNSKMSHGFPFKWKLWYIFKDLYFWNKIESGNITLTSPNYYSYITEVKVPSDSIFVFNLANLLAFEAGLKIEKKFSININRILEKKYVFHYIKGPAKLYLYGVGEIIEEYITKEASYEKNTIIGYSGNLERGLKIVDDLPLLIMNNNYIKESYSGEGLILRQKIGVTNSQLRKMNKKDNGIFGIVKELVGFL